MGLIDVLRRMRALLPAVIVLACCGPVFAIPPAYQPDLMVRTHNAAAFLGDNIYTTYGNQSWTKRLPIGEAVLYEVKLENDGCNTDTYKVLATRSTYSAYWRVRYYLEPSCRREITDQVTSSSGWIIRNMPARRWISCYALVTPADCLRPGDFCTLYFRVWSLHQTSKNDALRACTVLFYNPTPSGPRPDLLIRAYGSVGQLGDNIYNGTGEYQTIRLRCSETWPAAFEVKLENDGDRPCFIRLQGDSAPAHWLQTCLNDPYGGYDITEEITGSGIVVHLNPREWICLYLELLPCPDYPRDALCCVRIRAYVEGWPEICDLVRAEAITEQDGLY